MTMTEALQALLEYENDNLLTKVLLDRDVTAADTYTGTDVQKKSIDLCAADVYMMLSTHPEIREGSRFTKFDAMSLRAMADILYNKHSSAEATIDGTPLW